MEINFLSLKGVISYSLPIFFLFIISITRMVLFIELLLQMETRMRSDNFVPAASVVDFDELIDVAESRGLSVNIENLKEVLNEQPEIGLFKDTFGRTLTHVLSNRGELSPEEAFDLPGADKESLDGFTPVERAQQQSALDRAAFVA